MPAAIRGMCFITAVLLIVIGLVGCSTDPYLKDAESLNGGLRFWPKKIASKADVEPYQMGAEPGMALKVVEIDAGPKKQNNLPARISEYQWVIPQPTADLTRNDLIFLRYLWRAARPVADDHGWSIADFDIRKLSATEGHDSARTLFNRSLALEQWIKGSEALSNSEQRARWCQVRAHEAPTGPSIKYVERTDLTFDMRESDMQSDANTPSPPYSVAVLGGSPIDLDGDLAPDPSASRSAWGGASDPTNAHLVHGFVDLLVPVYFGNDLQPKYLPVCTTIKDLENEDQHRHLQVAELHRSCSYVPNKEDAALWRKNAEAGQSRLKKSCPVSESVVENKTALTRLADTFEVHFNDPDDDTQHGGIGVPDDQKGNVFLAPEDRIEFSAH